MFELMG
jgi:hypothetical protein